VLYSKPHAVPKRIASRLKTLCVTLPLCTLRTNSDSSISATSLVCSTDCQCAMSFLRSSSAPTYCMNTMQRLQPYLIRSVCHDCWQAGHFACFPVSTLWSYMTALAGMQHAGNASVFFAQLMQMMSMYSLLDSALGVSCSHRQLHANLVSADDEKVCREQFM